MFDILSAPLHWIPVRFPVLKKVEGDDEAVSVPGEEEIEVRVELVDRDEAKELFPNMFAKAKEVVAEEGEGAEPEIVAKPKLGETDLFLRVVKDWRKINAGGNPFPLNRENVERLLKVPMFGASFANAYIAALGGRVAIREGNSDGLPSGGQAAAPEAALRTSSSETADASA